MEFWVILSLLLIAVLGVISYIGIEKNKNRINFFSSYLRTELIIVSFYNNSKKLNFIVDSGANVSHLDSSIIPELKCEHISNPYSKISTAGGDIDAGEFVRINLTRVKTGNIYTAECGVLDLKSVMQDTIEEFGEDVHGVIGNDFLTKYGWIIDYPRLSIYV